MLPSETVYVGTCQHGLDLRYRCPQCQPDAPPAYPWMAPQVAPPQPAFGFRFVPSVCEHCFCRPINSAWDPQDGHEECCNCGVRRVQVT
jgi:hypothetical protein